MQSLALMGLGGGCPGSWQVGYLVILPSIRADVHPSFVGSGGTVCNRQAEAL
jgi:hypothetical protein